jgi:hypothetical protein
VGEIRNFGSQIEVPFVARHFWRECSFGIILVNDATKSPGKGISYVVHFIISMRLTETRLTIVIRGARPDPLCQRIHVLHDNTSLLLLLLSFVPQTSCFYSV